MVSKHKNSEAMKDADIPTIFNPRRVRAPSVVVTEEDNPRSVTNGPFSNTASLQHSDSGKLCHVCRKLYFLLLLNSVIPF